jgi:hypothetical protein
MPFTPVNELERLLMSAGTDPAARPAFYRALPEHELFIVTEGPLPEREQSIVVGENATMEIRMIDIDGTLHAPVFSSVERIATVAPRVLGYVAMAGRAVLSMLRGKPLVMNPGSEYGKIFTPEEVESILDGSIFNAQETPDVGGKNILLGQPKDYPHHVTEPLRRFLSTRREVKAAYLAHAFIADVDKAPHTLIGLDVAGDWQRVVEEAGIVVREVVKPGEIIDFVRLSPNASDTIGRYLQQNTAPFYQRKKWLGLF